jgi:hypothetical protein
MGRTGSKAAEMPAMTETSMAQMTSCKEQLSANQPTENNHSAMETNQVLFSL